MPAHSVIHPSPESLRAFGLGKMDDTSAGVLIDHLDQCQECSKAVAALSGDDFLNRIRQAHDQNATPTPAKSLSPILRDPEPALSAPKNPPPLPDLPPELAGHPQYEILRELGRGGMGVVYLAKNKLMDRLEVLKVVNKALLDRPSAVERFLREIRAAAKLSHANVVGAYSALQVGDLLAFAMEYVEGEDLAVVVDKQGPLPIAHACYYVQQAALGLQHACEKGMIHRDIKPQNLILARVGKTHVVKVLDFGLAKVAREKAEDTGLTGEGKMMGTPDYMAPEQSMDAASADIRADIYSLGCTLYHLLTGTPPFEGKSLYQILHAHQSVEARSLNMVRPEVPEALAAVVAKMIAKEADKRYQKPIEVVQALAVFVKPEAKKVPPKPAPDRPTRGTDLPVGQPIAPPLAEVVRKASATQVPAADLWNAMTGASGALTLLPESGTICPHRPPVAGKRWLMGGGVGVGVLLLALLGLWAAGVFKVKTKDGTIVLENVPDDAHVIVDGETVRLRDWEGKEVTIRVAAGKKHRLQVKREGFKVFGEEVEIDAGKRRAIVVRLEPKLAAKAVPPAGGKGSEIKESARPDPAPTGKPNRLEENSKLDRKGRIGSGSWRVEGGELIHSDPVRGNCCILFGDPSWTNYDYSFEVVKTNGAFGIAALFRARDFGNFMVFDLAGWQNRKYAVECFVKGKHNWITFARRGSMAKNTRYRVRVEVREDRFRCYVNDLLIYDFRDSRQQRGAVGFRCWGAAVRVHSIKVSAPDGKVLWEGPPALNASVK